MLSSAPANASKLSDFRTIINMNSHERLIDKIVEIERDYSKFKNNIEKLSNEINKNSMDDSAGRIITFLEARFKKDHQIFL